MQACVTASWKPARADSLREISRCVPLAAMQLRDFNAHGIPRTVSSWEFHGSMVILASTGLHGESNVVFCELKDRIDDEGGSPLRLRNRLCLAGFREALCIALTFNFSSNTIHHSGIFCSGLEINLTGD